MFVRKVLPFLLLITGVVAYIAYRTRPVPTPRRKWRRFDEGQVLDAESCYALQGIYIIEEARDFFGENAVIKWTYTVEARTTIYHLSLFCEKSGLYIICSTLR